MRGHAYQNLIVALDENGERYSDTNVKHTIDQHDRESYISAAKFLNESVAGADVFHFPVWIEPSIMCLTLFIGIALAYIVCVGAHVRESPFSFLALGTFRHILPF